MTAVAALNNKVQSQLRRVSEGIGAAAWEPGPLPTTTAQQYVEQSSYDQALAEYLARFGRKRKKR